MPTTVGDGCNALPDDAAVTNNIASLAIAAVVALGLIKAINRDRKEPERNEQPAQSSGANDKAGALTAPQGDVKTGQAVGWRAWLAERWSEFRNWWLGHGQKALVWLCAIVPLAFFVVFLGRRDIFISVGHPFAAVTMVVGLILYMIFNAELVDHKPENLGFLPLNYKTTRI